MNLTTATLPTSPLLGALWETFVFAELRKLVSLQDEPATLWFYRDQRAREIDFVIDSGGGLSFIEAKWQEHPRNEDARTIHAVSRELAQSNLPWKPGPHLAIDTPANRYDLAEEVTALGVVDLGEAIGPGSVPQVAPAITGIGPMPSCASGQRPGRGTQFDTATVALSWRHGRRAPGRLSPARWIGLITNSTTRLADDVSRLGTTGAFDCIVNSLVIGCTKPSACFCIHALRLGC